MNRSLAFEQERQLQPEVLITSNNPKAVGQSFSEAYIDRLQEILTHFSDNKYMDAEWSVTITSSGKSATLRFPKGITYNEGAVLRALVLDYLSAFASLASCKRVINDSFTFFSFLKEHNIFIENCRSSFINIYISRLDSRPELSVSQKNSLMRTVASLMDVCSKYGLLQGTGIIDCSHRWNEQKGPKRAPDSCVIIALDALFFNITNTTIPDSYRCLYFLLRLIPNRISEVLSMDIDCLTYPDIDVYAVSIPTSKETPYHAPQLNRYNRKLSGWCEGLMFEAICTQQIFARQRQSELKYCDRGYLFVSQKFQRIISVTEFNDFLADLCLTNQILDATGKQAQITSHDFRHVAIGERLRSDVISPVLAMLESNHISVEQTMSYGSQSIMDEASYLGAISEEVFQKSWNISSEKDGIAPIAFSKHKYNSIESQPFTRLIPGYGVCCVASCNPRFEQCFQCKHFQPDEVYLEYIENAIIFLRKKIATLQEKRGSKEVIEFNQQRLGLFQSYAEKISAESSLKMA